MSLRDSAGEFLAGASEVMHDAGEILSGRVARIDRATIYALNATVEFENDDSIKSPKDESNILVDSAENTPGAEATGLAEVVDLDSYRKSRIEEARSQTKRAHSYDQEAA